jgi:hypothetical protein
MVWPTYWRRRGGLTKGEKHKNEPMDACGGLYQDR